MKTWAGAVLAVAIAWAPALASAEAIEGLWVSQTPFGSPLSGALTVTRGQGEWRASAGDAQTTSTGADDALRFVFPNHAGEFRGALHGRALEGFWIQPAAFEQDQPFAAPLTLTQASANAWRGDITPLSRKFTLYLSVSRGADGVLLGAFRNPEFNFNGGVSQFIVTQEGDAVRFNARTEAGALETRLTATMLHNPDRLQITYPVVGAIALTRPTSQEAAPFFARPPGSPAYIYQRPARSNDGWRTARAREVGFDEAALTQMVQQVIDADPAARRPALIHSLLVARRGRLVLEEYFHGFDRDTAHDTRSAGKTFASVMLGAAMRQGIAIGPQTPIYSVFAQPGPFANPDPRKAQITLAHLMTHSAGLACNDNDDASPGNEGTMQGQSAQPDWWRYTLDLPMAHDPGVRYAYCSANINLVGGALTRATQTWLPQFFDRSIARPMQFGRYYWNLMPTNEGYLGGGAYLRPRDLLKIGQMYLDGGVWNGRRIVDAAWVRESVAPHIEISAATTGVSNEDFANFYIPGRDGYAWHSSGVRNGARVYADYAATGNGGQLLIVVPEEELVVVFTAGNYGQGGIWNRWRDTIVGAQIIPAIRR